MNRSDDSSLGAAQLKTLESWLHQGSVEASKALAKWLDRRSVVEIDRLEQLALHEAAAILSDDDEPIGFCVAQMVGLLSGEMIFAFDDSSGFALADLLLDQPVGTTQEWSEIAQSALLETTNILCCACLNSLTANFSQVEPSTELLPSPPSFNRDYAASLMEFALMGQAVASDTVVVAKTSFEIGSTPMKWTLLFVPDAESMTRMAEMLPVNDAAS